MSNMEKSVRPDETVEELFCYEVNKEDMYTKSIGVTGSGKYYVIETHEYNVGSGYSSYSNYYPIEPDEVSYYQKVAEDRKRIEEFKSLEEESSRLEDQKRLLTNGSDKDFYKKKRTDIIWWLKEGKGEHRFSFDKVTVYDLITDYPYKLTPQQKEIFDKENPYWKAYFQKKNIEPESENDVPVGIRYVEDITPDEYLKLRRDVGWMELPYEQAKACIDNAYYMVCVRAGGRAIGVVRLIWDGGYVAFLSDLIVDSEYRGQGIGRTLVESCLNKLKKDMKPGYKVKITLNSARGKEPFYEKFGFKIRPNDDAGAGMDQWLIK
ncbi:MAG: GNAT family N-acetyltransferase [Lachnospiraceae bacterium]|nr:GNAT family N-acetyltransferase [Lachnospiraceae bacterium]